MFLTSRLFQLLLLHSFLLNGSRFYSQPNINTGPHLRNYFTKSETYNVKTNWTICSLSSSNIMTSSNGNTFRVTGPLWGESTGDRWIPSHRPVTRSVDVFFDVRLNKRLSKQSRCGWFETPWRSLRRHCNESMNNRYWVHFIWRCQPTIQYLISGTLVNKISDVITIRYQSRQIFNTS